LLAACERRQVKPVEPKPPQVEVTAPATQEVTDYEEFTGRLSATESVDVRARVTGYLMKVDFKEGIRVDVAKDALLFEIDPRPYAAILNQAKANVLQADARLKQANADVKRNEPLVKSGAVTQQDLDKMVADRDAAAAQVEASKAAVDTAQLNLDFCRVTAPISGQISRKYVDVGNLIKADDTILTSIVSVDPIYAYFDVDERTLLMFRRLIREGKIKSARETDVEVDVALADEPGFLDEHGYPRHRGLINFGDNKVDPATGTLQIRATFDNKERLLSPGMFVRVRVPVGAAHPALLVPEQALTTDQGQKFVYVVTPENKVDVRYVRVGPPHGQLREIQQGLKPNDRVIVSGLQQVRRDIKVEIVDRNQASGVRNQESGVRSQGSGVRGPESGAKDGSGPAKSH